MKKREKILLALLFYGGFLLVGIGVSLCFYGYWFGWVPGCLGVAAVVDAVIP